MKNIFLNFVFIAIAGACIMTSCTKDKTADCVSLLGNSSNIVSDIYNENNPYDYCGRIHNEVLDYIINNNPHPTHEDIYRLSKEYIEEQYNISCNITYEDVSSRFDASTDFIINAIINHVSFDTIFQSEIIAGALDTLIAYSNSIMLSNTLPSPQEYASYMINQENRIISIKEQAGISPDEISEYDVALGTFAIARYSYSYWYEVENNPENAWNYAKCSSKRQDDDGDDEPGFWKKLWNGICDVAETVAEVTVKAVVDAAGFVYGGLVPVGPNSNIFGPIFDVGRGINTATAFSAEV